MYSTFLKINPMNRNIATFFLQQRPVERLCRIFGLYSHLKENGYVLLHPASSTYRNSLSVDGNPANSEDLITTITLRCPRSYMFPVWRGNAKSKLLFNVHKSYLFNLHV